MRILLLLSLMSLISTRPLYAATCEAIGPQDSLSVTPADTMVMTRKHPWLAGLEITGFNAALVGFNRIFYKDEDWSHLTLGDIKHNITHRYWTWDQDDLGMNAFRHPLHGTLFYLTARANGMSVGESSLYALGGSWMWEMLCEAQEPSANDMIYTTMGGITIGETLWRSGECLIGLFKKERKHRSSVPFSTSLSVGMRSFNAWGTNTIHDAYATWEMTYGNLFDDTRRGPFDYFNLSGTVVTGQKRRIVSQTRIDNQIWSRSVVNEPTKQVVAGIYNHYVFIRVTPLELMKQGSRVPTSYSYSEVGAIGPGIAYRIGHHTCWEQQLYVNGIMMGATPEYMYHSDSRGYSFGSGYGARLYSSLAIGNWMRIGLKAQCSHLFTWDGFYDDDESKERDREASIQGEEGNALTAILSPSVEWRPLKHLALQWNGQFMHTHLNYSCHPHTSTHAWEWQLGVKYLIGN